MKAGKTAAVLDANVFVLAVADTGVDRARAEAVLMATDVAWAPASVFAECVSAMREHVRRGNLTTADAADRPDEIEGFVTHAAPVPPLWRRALQLSEMKNHSPYDTLFVALAERENLRVVTFDRKLVAKFFGRCVGPAAYLAPNRAP